MAYKKVAYLISPDLKYATTEQMTQIKIIQIQEV